ncbi:MAG: hypothetical protein FWE52_01560 [Alphaproteobacteria bacterium]|nr:hypothetical protein [Alphaproteobacteria bacterium]
MKKLFACFLLVFCMVGGGAFAEWLPNFEDVPQMEKTYIIEDAGFVYSQPEGRIVQATVASDDVSRRQFQRFYRDALKELGWRNVSDKSDMQCFHRGTDELKIEIVSAENPLTAQFTLTPR